MKNLNEDIPLIERFASNTIEKFIEAHGMPSSIGFYCCPWCSWLTINFNLDSTLGKANFNCPDFQFLDFGILDFPEWEEEYNKEYPIFMVDNIEIMCNHYLGDENLNELIFNFLQPIVSRLKDKYKASFLLQLLDSGLATVL